MRAFKPSIAKSKMFFHNDNLFHATMFKFASLEGVWKIIHTNAIPLNRARIMANLRSNPQVEKIYEQHKQMVEYLKNKDFGNYFTISWENDFDYTGNANIKVKCLIGDTYKLKDCEMVG